MRLLGICVISLSVVVCGSLSAATTQRPQAVSPGSTGQLAHLAEACPTFSWTGVAAASAYRLVVYEVTEQGSLGRAVVQQALPRGASTWTAPLGQCLDRGGTYAWTVGATGAKGEAAWSDAALFRIAPGPTEAEFEQALAVVRSYLAAKEADPTKGASDSDLQTDSLEEVVDGPQTLAPAGTVFSADGNVDAVSFSGDGAMLTNLTPGNIAAGTAAIDISGTAATATTATSATTAAALATDPTDCPAGHFATTIDASGDLTCAPDGGIDHGFPSGNTRVGRQALLSNTTGFGNTASGDKALRSNTTGSNNTASGFSALRANTEGSWNTASGYQALYYNTTGSHNTATGAEALFKNSTGYYNTAMGYRALSGNTTGYQNTAIGYRALLKNSTGTSNTASGGSALADNTTGSANTASGVGALADNTTGSFNTATGTVALGFNTTGGYNTASGFYALGMNTTGTRNTAAGYQALFRSQGNRNIALGHRAGRNATTGSDNIFIANEGVAGDDSKIKIGTQGTQTATYVAGIHGTSLAGNAVVVTSSGQLGVASGATGDADTLDGLDSTAFATDAELATHTAQSAAHHTKPTIYSFRGFAGSSISGSSASYEFVGQTVSVTLVANQRVTGAATAVLGTTSGAPTFRYGLCSQLGTGPVTNLAGNAYTRVQPAGGVQADYSATASAQLSTPGPYTIGFCVLNEGAEILNSNDYVNGWIMVTG